MTISTDFTRHFALTYPIALAPMGGVAGGHLAATVAEAGGLGLVGGGYGDQAWLKEQLTLVRAETSRAWGVGLITWSLSQQVLDLALGFKPAVVLLSFGDPSRWASQIKDAGCLLMCQVQDVASAEAAVSAGADILVAQGAEAGGHGGLRGTFALVPAIVDLVAPVPVIAAGGIADGRGLAAALMLGAQGGMIGTRFYASTEALGHPTLKQELALRKGADTVKTQVFDLLRGYQWPAAYAGRAIRNKFVDQWANRSQELTGQSAELIGSFREAMAHGDASEAMIWAGECLDLIDEIEPAATLFDRIGRCAEAQLKLSATMLDAREAFSDSVPTRSTARRHQERRWEVG